ncbi:MAG: 4-(cytidine 5'-diphospho)-2-C-methyl-D-erythritol kinase [Ignavibacteriae bacterium]|nr:4-(cytidine 5'-diphospho)-2-C-methyl-D-erythritol kinase [Ignavibacteriota bacterium]
MIKNMILTAPAKINLGLKIINRRDDGFHNLETIFYPVKLSDEISIGIFRSKRNTNSVLIKSNNKVVPTDRTNICFKVIESFFRVFKIKEFFIININIKKNIPIGGGLGGGSSDAASILKFLIKFFNISILEKKKEILKIALSVGSDVPYFLIQKPCFAQSRGEIITSLNEFNLNKYKILLVNPNLHISTRWAFENLGYQIGDVYESNINKVKVFDSYAKDLLQNDFEEIVFKKYSELEIIKKGLISFGSEFSSMSGSGATMYGLFKIDEIESVKKAYEYYKAKNYFVFVS